MGSYNAPIPLHPWEFGFVQWRGERAILFLLLQVTRVPSACQQMLMVCKRQSILEKCKIESPCSSPQHRSTGSFVNFNKSKAPPAPPAQEKIVSCTERSITKGTLRCLCASATFSPHCRINIDCARIVILVQKNKVNSTGTENHKKIRPCLSNRHILKLPTFAPHDTMRSGATAHLAC